MSRDSTRLTSKSHGVVRNAVFALMTQATTALGTAVLTLFLARALEPRGFGVFSLALSIALIVVVPADLGISPAANRLVAEVHDDGPAVATIVRGALRKKLLPSAVVCGGLAAAAGPISVAYGMPALAWPLRVIALAVFSQSLFTLFSEAFVALRRIRFKFMAISSESAVETSTSIALVLLGAGATGAALGRVIGYSVGAAVGGLLLFRLIGRRSWTVHSQRGYERSKELVRFALPMFVLGGAFLLFEQVDVIIIGAVADATQVGLFQAPNRLATFLTYPGLAISNAVTPRLSEVASRIGNTQLLHRATRIMLILQGMIIAPLIAWSKPIIALLLGSEYAASAGVLQAMVPYIFLLGVAPLLTTAVTYVGEVGALRRRVPITLVAVAVNAAIDVALVPRIGIVGAAIGTDVAFVIYVAAHVVLLGRLLELRIRPLARTLVRVAPAVAAAGAVLWAFGTGAHMEWWRWVGGLAAASAAYLALLVALREISPREMRMALTWAHRRLRRRSSLQ